MRKTSLTRQALTTILVAELLCAGAFSCATVLHERHTRLRGFDVMLQGRSDSVLGAVQDAEDPEDNVVVDPAELSLPAADVFAVYSQGGRLLGASVNAPEQLIGRGRPGFSDRDFRGREYRFLQRDALRIIDREESGGAGLRRPVTILYGARTDRIWHEVFEAAGFSAVVSVILLGATTALLLVQLRKILRPLDTLAAAAGAISTRSLEFEPPPDTLGLRELAPLAGALSATMARLRDAFEAQHRFVGNAAHELKTAVAVVRSTVQLLTLRPRSHEEYQDGLRRVLEDNSRVEELVSRMLMLARFEERTVEPPERVNLAESVQEVVMELQSFAEANGIALQAALAPEVWVRLPKDRSRVLVSNLVVNAVQHSNRGAAVRIELVPRKNSPREAVLTVQDAGAGISAEALPHVFERFYREDTSRSRETGGAGLGLAICRAIVQAANGEIQMESRLGAGTKVTVSFRLN